MSDDHDMLSRIAAALERMAPPPHAPPQAPPRDDSAAYLWTGAQLAKATFAPLSLSLLTGIDPQKWALIENTKRLANGAAAHDALLWGARGSGKSALVKAAVGAAQSDGHNIALVGIATHDLATLPALFETVRGWTRVRTH
jgi:uncharacterized protein